MRGPVGVSNGYMSDPSAPNPDDAPDATAVGDVPDPSPGSPSGGGDDGSTGGGDDGVGGEAPDRRPLVIGGVVVAVVLLGLLGWLLLRDDDESVTSGSTTTSSSTTVAPSTAPSTSAPTSTTGPPTSTTGSGGGSLTVDDAAQVVWPDPGGPTRFTSPTQAAESFATTLVGFRSPVIGEFQQGDSRSGEVEVKPSSSGPVTTVLVRQFGTDDTWWVTGAVTKDITVTAPVRLSAIDSPMRTTGEALAFEGTVQVKVVADGSTNALGTGTVTGGGGPSAPFTGDIVFTNPGGGWGAVIYYTESGENGEVWSASVLRVGFIGGD